MKGGRRIKKKGKVRVARAGIEVIKLAIQLRKVLKKYSRRVIIAGSIRRKMKNPFDIDLLLIPKDKHKILTYLRKRGRVILAGEKKISVEIKGIKVDIMFTDRESWGASLLFFTGPFGANIWNRNLAKSKGYKLNQYGLFHRKSGRRVPVYTEKEIYEALGKTYRKPELRGNKR